MTDESMKSGSLDVHPSQEEDNDGEEEMYDQSHSEDYDEFAHFPWLKPIKVEIKAEDGPHEEPVGWCYAELIDREPIRATFYGDMEEPTNDTSELAFNVFDRWGCVKSELRDHPVKKGNGVWGTEMDAGKILFIEDVTVNETHRRKGYGRKLVEQVWDAAQGMVDYCEFAIAFATYNNTRTVEETGDALAPKDQEVFYNNLQRSAENFWYVIGFRCIGSSSYFAHAKNPSHPSKSLSAEDNYVRPLILRSSSSESDQVFPYDQAMLEANDCETLELLRARLLIHSATDPVWLFVDRHG